MYYREADLNADRRDDRGGPLGPPEREHEGFAVERDRAGEWPVPFWSETVRQVSGGVDSGLRLA